jgi:hypothetical protein
MEKTILEERLLLMIYYIWILVWEESYDKICDTQMLFQWLIWVVQLEKRPMSQIHWNYSSGTLNIILHFKKSI